MAKSIDDQVSNLANLRSAPLTDELRDELKRALAAKANVVVAKAADIAAARRLTDLAPAMEEAFARFLAAGDKADKACLAKTALARALNALAVPAEKVYLRGVRHVQIEASYGGGSDVAGELRSNCALGLAAMGHRDALLELSDLLMDSDAQCRLAAARGIALVGYDLGVLPLRVKVLAGDDQPEVIEECFNAIVKLSPAKSVEFVGRFLDSRDEDLKTAAAMALGASRQPAALELLLARYRAAIDGQSKQDLLPAIAVCRLPQAIDFLVEEVATAHASVAATAIEAMAPYRHDPAVAARVRKAAADRGDPALLQAIARHFPAG